MEIRDKLFTEEQYLKQLKMYDEDISYYEQMHLSGKHIGYDSLFNYRLRYLLVQYSMGQDIDNLKNNYVETIKTMPRFWTDNGFYIEMLWLLSIGIMLDYEDDLIQSLVQLIKDREAKDYIYDTLIRYRFPDWERTTNKVLYPSPYQAAITVTELAEQDKAEEKILCSQEAPDNIGNGIITDIYEYDNAFSYYVYHVKYIPNQYTTIISISYFYPYHEMNIFQGINSYKDWSVYLYEYDKERISKVHRYASRWGNMPAEEYNFAYENNLLCAIVGEKRLKNGELYIHWKNKKVYNKER